MTLYRHDDATVQTPRCCATDRASAPLLPGMAPPTKIVEDFYNRHPVMATMNFSIPDDLRDAFNREFSGQNKSAVIARLMQQAIAEADQQRRRQAAFEQLTAARAERPTLTEAAARAAREVGRP